MNYHIGPGMYLKKESTYYTIYTRIDAYCTCHYDGPNKDEFCARWGESDLEVTEIWVKKEGAPKSCYLCSVHRGWEHVYQMCDSDIIPKEEWDKTIAWMNGLVS